MMKRMIALTAFGAGYVAGAAAGRERYEQIRTFALKVKTNPDVREKAHQAAEAIRAETSPIRDKVSGTVHDKLSDLAGRGDSNGHQDTATGDVGGGQYEHDPFTSNSR